MLTLKGTLQGFFLSEAVLMHSQCVTYSRQWSAHSQFKEADRNRPILRLQNVALREMAV